MSEASNAETEDSPYVRAPWPLVTAGLLAVIGLALAIGFFANRNLRPSATIIPTAASAPSSAFTSPAVVVAPTPLAISSTVVTIAQTTPTELVPLLVATPTLLPPLPTVKTEPPTTTPAVAITLIPIATPFATVLPELAAEISDAYKTYWEVRAEALRDLDTSRLSTVMAGAHLAAVEDRIAELRSEGQAIDSDVDHNYVVVEASANNARVADAWIDHSVYVDLRTQTPSSTPTGETVAELYTMTKTDGIWRVVSIVRSS
jgi:hypothetical protein